MNFYPFQKIILNLTDDYFRKIFFGILSLTNNKIKPSIKPKIILEYITVECLK